MKVGVRITDGDTKSGISFIKLEDLICDFLIEKLPKINGKIWFIANDGSKLTKDNLVHLKNQWMIEKIQKPMLELIAKEKKKIFEVYELFEKNMNMV